VHPHPDADRGVAGPRLGVERPLRVDEGRDGISRALEDEEEAVALGQDLGPVVARDGVANQLAVADQERLPAVGPEPLGELGRALDVGEGERDRPRGERPR
jgi:hypothetical protein